ncbi:hypothetical protein BY996DRAFT_6489403 [Phakopsora pachyrhizi]|nr:hypothetical protein BY996DRAFT_6489403 [Phakopsora pachyrhizi]
MLRQTEKLDFMDRGMDEKELRRLKHERIRDTQPLSSSELTRRTRENMTDWMDRRREGEEYCGRSDDRCF